MDVPHLVLYTIFLFASPKENSADFFSFAVVYTDTSRKPIWSLEETHADSMNLLFIRDTIWAYDSLHVKLGRDYSQLFAFIFKNALRPAKILATYYSNDSPVVFEAAVQIEKFPRQSEGRIEFKKLDEAKVIIAHFQGPYSEIKIAYGEIQKFLKAQNKVAKGLPFEVYLNNPSAVKDPFDLKTDLYQPIRDK